MGAFDEKGDGMSQIQPGRLNKPAETRPESPPIKPLTEYSVRDFVESLAAKTPAPGGGSVAALTGALAAAQACMTIAYTLGKPRFQAVESRLHEQIERLHQAAAQLQSLMEEDRAAYVALNNILKIPAASRPMDQFAALVVAAIQAPQTVATVALQVLESCRVLQDKINPLLASDLRIAAILARAAVAASEQNMLVNVPLLPDPEQARHFTQRACELRRQAEALS